MDKPKNSSINATGKSSVGDEVVRADLQDVMRDTESRCPTATITVNLNEKDFNDILVTAYKITEGQTTPTHSPYVTIDMNGGKPNLDIPEIEVPSWKMDNLADPRNMMQPNGNGKGGTLRVDANSCAGSDKAADNVLRAQAMRLKITPN